MNDEEILLHLNRKYSKDEEVKFMLQKLRIKIGEQESYIHELEDKLASVPKFEVLCENYKREIKSFKSEEKYKNLQEHINNRDKKIKSLRAEIVKLVTKLNRPQETPYL